ncbi:MAG: DUF4091 domain-containing protein [Tannerella sp.]|jgi:hypothetical protein|nr:DUF4091 domain-containing protein [Tannerella sp.]
MKKNRKKVFPAVAMLLAVAGCSSTKVNDAIYCVQLDPLEKVFKEQLYFVENGDTADVAKGETASFQWVFRSIYPVKNLKIEAGDLTDGNNRIPVDLKAFTGYAKGNNCHGCGGSEQLPSVKFYSPESGLFPDPLLNVETMDVASLSNQPLWVDYTVPREAPAGVYSAEIILTGEMNGKPFRLKKQVAARVYNVTLPEQTLWTVNWYWLQFLDRMNGGQAVEPYSDRYWELHKALVNIMREHGQNVYPVSSVHLCDYAVSGSQYTFDFSRFDRTVEFLIREGGMKRMEGDFFNLDLKSNPVTISIPTGDGVFRRMTLDNDTVNLFLSQYIPALYNHLRSKGWDKIFMQSISDEPTNAQSYNERADYLKQLEPEIKIIEATILGQKVENSVHVHTPIIWYCEKEADFYRKQQEAGNEVWYYISCDGQGKYLNRFYERELIQNRLLHWFNYRYNLTGYLHWGFNWWEELSGDSTLYADNHKFPAGDAFLVYPAFGKVYSSIRLKAQRDGIADYELLRLLEKKDPANANELARAVIRSYDRYDTNITSFRETRRKLLTRLSE